MQDVTLDIGGMRCDNCARSLTEALTALDGVANPRVSFALEEAQLDFDPNRTSLDVVLDAIVSAGFRAASRATVAEEPDSLGETLAEIEESESRRRRTRMQLGIGLSALIMLLGMGPGLAGLPDFPGRIWLVCSLGAIVQFHVGSEFHVGAWHAARRGSTTMDTLVSLGSSVAFFYSFAVLVCRPSSRQVPIRDTYTTGTQNWYRRAS